MTDIIQHNIDLMRSKEQKGLARLFLLEESRDPQLIAGKVLFDFDPKTGWIDEFSLREIRFPQCKGLVEVDQYLVPVTWYYEGNPAPEAWQVVTTAFKRFARERREELAARENTPAQEREQRETLAAAGQSPKGFWSKLFGR